MGNVSSFSKGQEFNSFKVVEKVAKETLPIDASFAEQFAHQQNQQNIQDKINNVSRTFDDRYAENGEVEIRIQDDNGVAVVQSKNGAMHLSEMAEQGGALARYAIVLRDHDENKDGWITEDELYTSGSERFGNAMGKAWDSGKTGAVAGAGAGAIAGAGVGGVAGGVAGTVLAPGAGTAGGAVGGGWAGAKVGAGVGAVTGFLTWAGGSLLWEAGAAIYDSVTDKSPYNTGEDIR